MELDEGDIVLCTVDRIVGTTVFVKIDGNGEGSIVTSEIAPGRIRNLRDYVVPKKRIVCKILRIDSSGNIHLSLRRVTLKEQKEVLESHDQEKSAKSILRSVLGEKAEKVIEKILEESKVVEFLEEAKKDAKKLEKLVGKEKKKILEILNKQKKKKKILKKKITLNTTSSNGLELIKEALKEQKDVEIHYISAGHYT